MQLSIYPSPEPELVLQEEHSELERTIGVARAHATMAYENAASNVHGLVDKWIGVEEKVERELFFLSHSWYCIMVCWLTSYDADAGA